MQPDTILSDEQIAEIEARWDAATPGPFDVLPVTTIDGDTAGFKWGRYLAEEKTADSFWDSELVPFEDATFYSHASEDIPALCATVRALKAANKALAKDVVTATNQAHDYRDECEELRKQLAHWQERTQARVADVERLEAKLAQVTARVEKQAAIISNDERPTDTSVPEGLEPETICGNCGDRLYQTHDPNNIYWYHAGTGVRCPTRFAEPTRASVAPPEDATLAAQIRNKLADANPATLLAEIAELVAPRKQGQSECEHGVLWSMECLTCGPSDYVAAPSPPVAPSGTQESVSIPDAISVIEKMRDEYSTSHDFDMHLTFEDAEMIGKTLDKVIARLRSLSPSAGTEDTCEWSYEGSNERGEFFATACGDVWRFGRDVNDSGVRFCPFCGKTMRRAATETKEG